MQIFGGLSNSDLIKKVGDLGVPVGEVSISKFANDEKRVSVAKGGGMAVILQSFSRPVDEQIVEFCLLADALSRAGYSELERTGE